MARVARGVHRENKERLKDSLARQGDLAWQLARDEADWLELHEALEQVAE